MITVEDVKQKMPSEAAKTATVLDSSTKVVKKKPLYKKPLFWIGLIGGVFIAYKIATKGKNGSANTPSYQ